MAFETAEQSAMANPSTLLAELAGATGGLVLSDSNDSRKMAQMIADDISSYWEVTYRPDIEVWDGSFHPLIVKVNRKTEGASPQRLLRHPARNSRSSRAVRSAFALGNPIERQDRGAAVRSPNSGPHTRRHTHQGRYDHRTAARTLRSRAGCFRLIVSLSRRSARFRNAQGEVVDRQSQPVNYQGPLDKLETAKQGLFHWRYAYRLPPGEYTVEVALQDRVGLKMGVRKFHSRERTRVEHHQLGAPGSRLLENRRLRTTARGGYRIHAACGAQVRAGWRAGRGHALYFLVHRAASIGDAPTLEAEIFRNGELAARMPIDATSTLPGIANTSHYVITLPWRALHPGSYEIRISAKQGTMQAATALKLELTPAPGYQPPPQEAVPSPDLTPRVTLQFSELKMTDTSAQPTTRSGKRCSTHCVGAPPNGAVRSSTSFACKSPIALWIARARASFKRRTLSAR